jgi:hypothetical protein
MDASYRPDNSSSDAVDAYRPHMVIGVTDGADRSLPSNDQTLTSQAATDGCTDPAKTG